MAIPWLAIAIGAQALGSFVSGAMTKKSSVSEDVLKQREERMNKFSASRQHRQMLLGNIVNQLSGARKSSAPISEARQRIRLLSDERNNQ